ncbi:GNAT family N-acetyltransferase [Gynuella sunshinyii]|uniref:Sortase and related acyltransferase n=1 Tax=Gynuella sunshinyii YC6258 TaxID=1445510 RepID=A0A0C5VQ77_9GAMM|nr:GNAT family N-acetyltransferase [Gynuella sunshinyii]AJQ92434.1 sortase and related acyltransferase [Gynuella sunshinyii YC6258]
MMINPSPAAVLRPCLASDIDAITAIYSHGVLNSLSNYEYVPPTTEAMLQRYQAIVQPGYPYLVAEVSSTIAGFAYAGPYRTRPGYRYTVEDSVYIHPEYTGRGIGHQLLSAVIDECTHLGFRQMVAIIGDPDNTASLKLHTRLGFAHVGRLPGVGWKGEHWLDSILMQRPLGSADSDVPGRS